MKNRITILNELRAISPVLADHQPVMPYEVPVGYFDGLADQVLHRIMADEAGPVLGRNGVTPYRVPEGYFEQLPDRLLALVGQDPAFREPISRSVPYTVPEEYFEQLPQVMLARIRALESDSAGEELESLSPLLSRIGKQLPYSLPEGYFNELPDNATDGAKAIDLVNEELENLSPLMEGLKAAQAYEVPPGYFESLPNRMLQLARHRAPSGRVVSMSSFGRRIMRYAVAAVVAGLVLTSGWMYLLKSPNTVVAPDNAVSLAIPDSIPDDALEAYVENQTSSYSEAAVANADAAVMNEADLREMLADVSDAELQKYMEQSGAALNLSTN